MNSPTDTEATVVSPLLTHREALPDIAEPPQGPENYSLGREIARGGMGCILEATDQKLSRTVAVKVVLLDHDADTAAKQRFVREAEVLALLAHPNIVPIYDIVWEDGVPLFYTMKLVKGRTLQRILDELRKHEADTLREFTLDRLLLIFRKVCDAIAFAHSKGVLHRDLKPENIMVGEFGEVLVMDWGLAKRLNDEAGSMKSDAAARSEPRSSLSLQPVSFTLQGSVMGTPQYMSPEQARGETDELDVRSDIFSLGGILYAILTLRPPVEGKTLEEVLMKVTNAQITSPAGSNIVSSTKGQASQKGDVLEAKLFKPLPHTPGGRVPGALSSVVMKALQLGKAQRYQSVVEFSADIEAYQGGFATKAEHAGLGKQLMLLIRRNRGIFSTAAAAWLLISVLAVWFIINLRAKEQRALAGEQTALVEKEASRRSAARASLSLAEASLREANGVAMQTALNDVPEDLRDTTWSYLLAQSDSSIARLRTGSEAIESAAADPTRPGVFAVVDGDQKVTVMNVRTGERLLEVQSEFEAAGKRRKASGRCCVAFSPDGQHIAVGCDGPGGVKLYAAKDGTKIKEWQTPSTRRLEFGRNDALLREGGGVFQVWNPLTATLWWAEETTNSNIGVKGAFTPGGNEVVKYTSKTRLQLVNANDGSLIRDLGGRKAGYSWFMAVRPDGNAVVTLDESAVTECVSLEDGRTLFALPGKKKRTHMGFSHDGSILFTAALRDEGIQAIEVWDAATGAFVRSLLGGRGQIAGLALHPASHELLIAGPDTRVWDTTGPTARWQFAALPSGNIAFWGPEDWVFGRMGDSATWGLYRLLPDGVEPLWRPDTGETYHAETSADGSLAVLIRPGFAGRDATLLRKSESLVEQVGEIKTGIAPFRVRPSPKASRIVFMSRTKDQGLSVRDAAGKKAVKLEDVNVQRVSDIGWLDEHRLLGLVTLYADRGDPGSQESFIVWDADNGQVIKTATHPTALDALAIAPDGSRFAEAGADKVVRIRDAATLAVQKEFRAHDAPINVLSWHASKPLIATGSDDLSVKVWNRETGRLVTEYRDLLNPPTHLTFSPTGHLVGAKTFKDNRVRIWQLEAEQPATIKPKIPVISDWEDLLGTLTPELVARIGHGWQLEKGALYSPTDMFSVFPLQGNLSHTSYQVHVKVRQLTSESFFHLVLPVADRMVGFDVDGDPADGYWTALLMVDGQRSGDVPGSVHGRQIHDTDLHDLDVTVRLSGDSATITTTLDSKPLYQWTGLTASLSKHPGWRSLPGNLALGAFGAKWMVTELKVKRLADLP